MDNIFCFNAKCKNTKCERNPKNIQWDYTYPCFAFFKECEYWDVSEDAYFDVDVELLKEQKPKTMELYNGELYCPSCGEKLKSYYHYCNECGRAVKWE